MLHPSGWSLFTLDVQVLTIRMGDTRISFPQCCVAVNIGPVRQKFCSHCLPPAPLFPPIHEAWPSISITLLSAITYKGWDGNSVVCTFVWKVTWTFCILTNKQTQDFVLQYCNPFFWGKVCPFPAITIISNKTFVVLIFIKISKLADFIFTPSSQ